MNSFCKEKNINIKLMGVKYLTLIVSMCKLINK